MINPDEDNYMPIGGIHKINSKSFLSMSQKRCHGNSDLVLFTVFSTKFMCSFIYLCLFVCMAVCTSVSTVSSPPSLPLFSLPLYRLHLCVFVSLCICLYLCHCIFVSLYFCRSVSVRLFCYSVSLSLFLVLFSFRCMLLMPTRHIPSFSTFHIVSLPPPLSLCFSYAVFLCRRL